MLLASLLHRPNAADTLDPAFSPDALPDARQRALATWILAAHDRDAPPTPAAAALQGHDPTWLAELKTVNLHHGSDHLGRISRALAAAAFAREVRSAADRVKAAAAAHAFAPEKLNEAVSTLADSARANHVRLLAPAPADFPTQVDDYLKTLRARLTPGAEVGVSTGLEPLDAVTGGLHPGRLVILAGRPGSGKTTLALNIAQAALKAQRRVAVQSHEMYAEELTEVLIGTFGIPLAHLRQGRLTRADLDKLEKAQASVASYDLDLADGVQSDTASVISAFHEAHARAPLDLAVIDFLQLIRDPTNVRQRNRNEQLGELTGKLKTLARTLDCPVLALSQLNRDIERRINKAPTMADLRDSGELEQAADLVLILSRPEGQPHTVECHVVKNRFGETGTTALLTFEGGYGRFAPPETPV